MTEEDYLIGCIKELQRQYEQAAKPFVDRLVQLRSLQPQPPVWVSATKQTVEALRDAGVKFP